MSRIFCTATPKVKPLRKSPRPVAPFAAGIFPKPVRFEPSEADRRWAAQVFNGGPEPDYDTLAGEAAFLDAMAALTPPPVGTCRSCGELAEVLSLGLCLGCEAIADRLATPY